MPLESLDRVREKFDSPFGKATVYNILKLKDLGYDVERLPYSIRILLENAARHSGKVGGALEAVHALAQWPNSIGRETPFMPHRVLLQDYTGVPLVVDLAGMRDAAKAAGIDPGAINSQVPVDLVIDHSIQVDAWGSGSAFSSNLEKEYERNAERYSLLKWARTAFKGMRVFPPGKGICHQFNLEYLAQVVAMSGTGDGLVAYPDTLVGADSHTTMVNGLGCLGWGVGGIEAEANMLGQPLYFVTPDVIGVRLTGKLPEGATATDLALTVTQKLREHGVVAEKTGFYSLLFLFTLAVNPGQSDSLLAALNHFRRDYEANRLVEDVLPDLFAEFPARYRDVRLQDLAQAMHRQLTAAHMAARLEQIYADLPEPALTPTEAFERLMDGAVDLVALEHLEPRTAAVLSVVYPPGIPVIVPGERFGNPSGRAVIAYLREFERWEQAFPGFENEVQGVVRSGAGSRMRYHLYCVR